MSNTASRRVLALFPGALGDFICFLPALRALAEDSAVDLLAHSEFAEFVAPSVKVASQERYEIRRLFVAGASDDARVRKFFDSYAAVYSWMGSQVDEFTRQLQAVCAGAARVFPFHPADPLMHQGEYYLSCVAAADRDRPLTAITPPAQAEAWCELFWRQNSLGGNRVLALAPGSGANEKNWPVDFFRAVAEWWRSATQSAVIVLVGPVEAERGGFESLRDMGIAAPDLSLAQTAALLARSDVYLGNDSGVTHLAAAVGVRTVALFGPSNAQRWAPRGRKVAVLSRNVACAPCEVPVMKNCSHHACLTGIYPSEVIAYLRDLPEVATLTRGGAGIKV